jgi:hypothetical protein
MQKKRSLIPLSNYRPITILNTDTQLIAYALAQRFKNVLPLIISNDQNGYIKNKGNNKITELRTIFQRESQNS